MESIETSNEKVSNGAKSFIKHVFNFDDDSKNEMFNIIQYSLLAIFPVLALNKFTQRFIPDTDETKSNLEILIEVMGQIIIMFIGILFIHRIVTFIPTYSKTKYADFNVTNIIVVFLVIVLSLQTKLGEKVNILLERIMEIVEGRINIKEGQTNISKPNSTLNSTPNSNYIDSQNYQKMPLQQPQPQPQPQQPQRSHQDKRNDYQSMYSNDTISMPDASHPNINNSVAGMETFTDSIQAANEVTGSFGTAY